MLYRYQRQMTLRSLPLVIIMALSFVVLCGCRTSEALSAAQTTPGSGAANDAVATFPDDFFFGVATAPAHIEDHLSDMWLQFAKADSKNGVRAWRNAGFPEMRLNFWSDYKTEIDLAHELGAKVFRMGVDWGRLVPTQPVTNCPGQLTECMPGVTDRAALAHYLEIVRYARSLNMSVMVTLYHHSLPIWLMNLKRDSKGNASVGGWTSSDAIGYFNAFASDVVTALRADVDLWVIFNEPAIFASLAYGVGIWPPAQGLDLMQMFQFGYYSGDVYTAFNNMIAAHKEVYGLIKKIDTISTADSLSKPYGPAAVGIAHNVGYHTGESFIDKQIADYTRNNLNYYFIDGIKDQLDFLGLNYYGEEHIHGGGIAPLAEREYSESGRGINPTGLLYTLQAMHKRYARVKPPLPIFITENGISDSTDLLRPAFLLEHLLAIAAARRQGIDVKGYILWTLSDNWEWADGYCPKFGVVAVDRSTPSLTRKRRDSFKLYQTIAASHQVTQKQRLQAWSMVRENIGKNRPFCRSSDGKSSLDTPAMRPIVDTDWRFAGPEAL